MLITGGLAPVSHRPADDVYAATWRRVREANERYHARYPDDRARLREALAWLDAEDVRLRDGARLTPRRFRQLGMSLGSSTGFERLHHLLELPFGSAAFLHDAQAASPWERNPIYALLHESSYADGCATRWSAQRLAPDDALRGDLLGAEHVFDWMWEDHAGLRPSRAAAMLLAEHRWPMLYDLDRLGRNEVPVAATVHADDVYVEKTFAEETARSVRGLRAWITNEYGHDDRNGPFTAFVRLCFCAVSTGRRVDGYGSAEGGPWRTTANGWVRVDPSVCYRASRDGRQLSGAEIGQGSGGLRPEADFHQRQPALPKATAATRARRSSIRADVSSHGPDAADERTACRIFQR